MQPEILPYISLLCPSQSYLRDVCCSSANYVFKFISKHIYAISNLNIIVLKKYTKNTCKRIWAEKVSVKREKNTFYLAIYIQYTDIARMAPVVRGLYMLRWMNTCMELKHKELCCLFNISGCSFVFCQVDLLICHLCKCRWFHHPWL